MNKDSHVELWLRVNNSPHCGLDVTSHPEWLKCHYSEQHASEG